MTYASANPHAVINSISMTESSMFAIVKFAQVAIDEADDEEEKKLYQNIINATNAAQLALLEAKPDVRQLFSINKLPVEQFRDH